LPASVLKRKPENYTFSQAAAFGSAYFTAYVALSRRSHIQSGQWLLVHGAAGGVGLAAVDLGHALGLQVIASSASARKRELIALEYRPTALLDPSGDFREHVLRITNGAGADAIFDPVGGDVFDKSLRCVAFNGEYLVVGFTSGRIPHVPANIPLLKGFSIVGVRAGEYMRRFPDRAQEDKQALWTMARTGVIRPRVHAEYSLLNWRRAFDAVTHREVLGRVVLKPSA
jgi:NADPH2:quinone reductase